MDTISALILLSAILVGVNIGANSASNAIGVIVGSNLMSFKKAVFFVSVIMLMGALLQGGRVIDTVGSDLMPTISDSNTTYFEEDLRLVLSTLLAAIVLVGLATFFSIPIATSHTMIGAIVGVLFSVGAFEGIDKSLLLKIILSWLITPLSAIFAAYVIYRYLMMPLSDRLDFLSFNRVFKVLLFLAAIFLSYSLGANNVGNAVGPIMASKVLEDQVMAVFLIGVSMGLGASLFSKGVVDTVGKKITTLGPAMAFTAQLASGLVIYAFTLMGIPISSTQAVVGGVMGVGLTKGVSTVNLKTMEYIFLGWILTPLLAGFLGIMCYSVISSI